jgi:hypothetical protein
MASLVPSYAQQEFRLIAESDYGVQDVSAVWRRMNAFRLSLSPTIDTETFASSGDSVPSIVNVNDDYGEGSIEGKVDYETLQYPFSSLFGAVSPTVPGGGTIARRWNWNWTGRGIITPKSYRMCVGSPAGAEHMPGAVFNGFGVNGNREGMDLTADVWGLAVITDQVLGGYTPAVQQVAITGTPTGGTFTLRAGGQETGIIQYNATGAQVALAVQTLLTSLGSAILVAGAGGPLPTTPATLTFTKGDPGTLTAGTVTLTAGTNPAVVVTVGTPAVDAATDIAPKPMFPLHGSVYFDNSWAALGTTQLKHAYDMDISIGEKYERTKPINRLRDSDSYVEIADQDHTVELSLAVDYRQRKILEDVRIGDMRFFRYEAVGPIIEGAIRYDWFMDMSLFIQEVGEGEEMNNVYVRPFTFRVGRDGVSGNAMAARITNTRTTY